ncbi:MAG: phage major capsid protein [Dehalococcoidia bacterium]|nr:phage major capsid protein [Dehalococcoidia bacterium]
MALTLAEAAKLSNDILLQGVIETIIKDSPILQRLPFVEIAGNGLTYNREATAPSAAFFDVGDTWTESTPTFTQQTVTLKIMGGDADIDNFLIATRSNIQDLEAAVVELKAKAVRQLFEQTFVTGDATANPKSFDGLDKVIDPAQSLSMGANGGSLTLDKLDEIIDKVLGGKPDLLLMSRRSRRIVNKLARTSGSFLEADRDEFGQMLQFYDGIAIGVSDYISDAQTVGTSTDCSTVYAFQAGEGGLVGLTAPGGLQIERVGSLETKDARRTRIKWYASLALFNAVKLARLTGVRP